MIGRPIAPWLLGTSATLLVRAALAQEDPGVAGSHLVSTAEYSASPIDLGCDGQGANCSIPNAEFLAEVRYPTDLTNGPFPLVVMLHGRHAPCYKITSGSPNANWPCSTGYTAVPSYKGYDYIASLLASHGIIVVSISANAINAVDNMVGGGYYERAELIQRHLNQWKAFNETGGAPFGTSFVGRVDLSRVGTMGHSRGGRAVIDHYLLNASLGSPYGIQAVLPLAPIRNSPTVVNHVPLGVMLGYCDGDIENLVGVRYLDDSRYNVADDNAPKFVWLGMGANHNYFNRYWTPDQFGPGTCCANPASCGSGESCVSKDDWSAEDPSQSDPFCGTNATGNGRLDSAEQRGLAKAYIAAFFRRYLQDATQFDPLLQGDDLPPPSAPNAIVYPTYFPGALDRKDLNRLTSSAELSSNDLGGVTVPTAAMPGSTGLAQYSLCGPGTSGSGGFLSCVTVNSREPHTTTVLLELGWTAANATYSDLLPVPKRDVSNFNVFQFRVGVDYSSTRNAVGEAQDFSIRLIDGSGRSSTLRASDYSDVLYYPPGAGSNRASVLSTLRIRTDALLNVDKTNIVSVDFVFDQKPSGTILVSDIAFSGEGTTAAEEWVASNAISNL